MVSLSAATQAPSQPDGVRPVNLKTDLGPLADLIELAFSDSMDHSGRAAVHEMRMLSKLGGGLTLLMGMNDLVQGIGLGFVYVVDGRLVGNASIYPANMPRGTGEGWIIANVAVHPEYRGRGIARQLMQHSLHAIRERGGKRKNAPILLQVETGNVIARRLYESLGFVNEGEWHHWRRSPTLRMPPAFDRTGGIYITRRRFHEWRAEFALVQSVRPSAQGGIGWLRPLSAALFRPSLRKQLIDLISLRSFERLVIRRQEDQTVQAALWIESAFGASSVQLTLFVAPEYIGLYDEALINLAARRYSGRSALTIEHPAHDTFANALLERYGFHIQRTLVHMRYTE